MVDPLKLQLSKVVPGLIPVYCLIGHNAPGGEPFPKLSEGFIAHFPSMPKTGAKFVRKEVTYEVKNTATEKSPPDYHLTELGGCEVALPIVQLVILADKTPEFMWFSTINPQPA